MIEIKEEKKYPIYHIGASWKQDNLDHNNAMSNSIMFKEDPGIEAVRQQAMEWWETFIKQDKYKNKGCQLVELKCYFIENETWCETWFSHYSFNTHLSDSDLLKSFEAFVNRKMPLTMNIHDYTLKERKEQGIKTYCLMGAEDRWRWKGPCRCEHCVKKGITVIDH